MFYTPCLSLAGSQDQAEILQVCLSWGLPPAWSCKFNVWRWKLSYRYNAKSTGRGGLSRPLRVNTKKAVSFKSYNILMLLPAVMLNLTHTTHQAQHEITENLPQGWRCTVNEYGGMVYVYRQMQGSKLSWSSTLSAPSKDDTSKQVCLKSHNKARSPADDNT